MKYQFEGFAEGDRVRITRPEDHYASGQTYEGVLDFYTDGLDEGDLDVVQFDLLLDDNPDSELLESGPDTCVLFAFTTIEKVEA